MEEHFLKAYVSGEPGFKAEPWYNAYGDCVVYQCVPEARVADRIDEVLTLYRSAIDNRVIGFQIKGVRAIMDTFDFDALTVESTEDEGRIIKIAVGVLIMAAVKASQNARTLDSFQAYREAMGMAERSQADVEIGEPIGA